MENPCCTRVGDRFRLLTLTRHSRNQTGRTFKKLGYFKNTLNALMEAVFQRSRKITVIPRIVYFWESPPGSAGEASQEDLQSRRGNAQGL